MTRADTINYPKTRNNFSYCAVSRNSLSCLPSHTNDVKLMVPSVAQLSAQHLALIRGVYQDRPTETPWQWDICVEQPLLRG